MGIERVVVCILSLFLVTALTWFVTLSAASDCAEGCSFSENQLTGTIPSEIGLMTNLGECNMRHTFFFCTTLVTNFGVEF